MDEESRCRQISTARRSEEAFKLTRSLETINLVRAEQGQDYKSQYMFAYQGGSSYIPLPSNRHVDSESRIFFSSQFSVPTSSIPAKCYHVADKSIHGRESTKAESDTESVPRKWMLLKPGERRGWWCHYDWDHRVRQHSSIRGAVNDSPLEILLDSGADVCLMKASLARKLDLEIKTDKTNRIHGIGEQVVKSLGYAWAKVTFGS